ncbi:hypothetical protein [Proteus vulgaris]|uniref:hypothetical protein n=1 Tax=Proteus vulgaris TaxID=585 RepID=UPI0013D27BEC|nr:hypothetical protein [Proteus vulgaris]
MDKSRQQFEEWSDGKDLYNISPFDIWKASRESLEVELPSDVITGHDGMFDEGLAIGYNNALEECKEMLISNGVKIKNE